MKTSPAIQGRIDRVRKKARADFDAWAIEKAKEQDAEPKPDEKGDG